MRLNKIALYLLMFLALSDVFHYATTALEDHGNFTTYELLLKYSSVLFILYMSRKVKWKDGFPKSLYLIFIWMLFWNFITLIRGIGNAKDYWDWKEIFYVCVPFFFVPFLFILGKNIDLIKLNVKYLYGLLFPIGFILIPFSFTTNEELYSRVMLPAALMIIFLPYLKRKAVFTLSVALVSIFIALDLRTNIIKIVFSVLIVSTYFLKRMSGERILKFARVIFFIAPIILLSLAVFGNFNVLSNTSEKGSLEVTHNNGESESITSDTRTLLYFDTFSTMMKNSYYWVIGKGAGSTYESGLLDFGDGRGRYASEVGFLNTLLYSGFIGVFLYGLMLFYTSYYAVYKSNNWLCKMLGVLIASRWFLFFLEEFTQFDLNFYFLWMIMGLVSNQKFRNLSDLEIKAFLNPPKRIGAYLLSR